jgi:predicted naringenin-chalcone synthase
MSSPTVLFILKQQLELGTRGLIAAAAFGPGLTAEMGLFRAN